MDSRLAAEFFLPVRPGTVDAVEHACSFATTGSTHPAVAVAVDQAHVARASDLLFGTGVGIVADLGDDPTHALAHARLSVATGATEIALPRMVLDQGAIVAHLRSVLGSAIPVTVEVTDPNGFVDLHGAEIALALGADFVSYRPGSTSAQHLADAANLLALAAELDLGGVKLASPTHGDATFAALLREHRWAANSTRARLRVPVPLSPSAGDLRP